MSSESGRRHSRRHRSERHERHERRERAPVDSRNSSARSSGVYHDDYLRSSESLASVGRASVARSLRSPASRLSLFASTRKEFEFDFDDAASSVYEQADLEEEEEDEAEAAEQNLDDTVVIDPIGASSPPALLYGPDQDLYDLLCLPRNPSIHAIRRAYHRLFVLLYPDSHPVKIRNIAEKYFVFVQTAFEILIDPGRRLKYDLNIEDPQHPLSHLSDELEYQEYRLWHAEFLRRRFSHLNADEIGSLEIGINAEALMPRPKPGSRRSTPLFKPFDFALSHSSSISLPRVGHPLDQAFHNVKVLLELDSSSDNDTKGEELSARIPVNYQRTFITIGGSIYGFLQDAMSMPVSILADTYQPAFANDVPRRAVQMIDGRIIPSLTLRLQHQLPDSQHGQPVISGDTYEPGTIVELESDVLPDPTLGFRVTREVVLPRDTQLSMVQIASKMTLCHKSIPRFGATLQRPTAGGMLRCKVETGDWMTKTRETCYAFSQFTRINKRLLSLDFPPPIAPRVEVAYKVGSSFKPPVGFLPGRASDRGIRGLDWDMENDGRGSWTVSATAEPSCLGSSVRYAIDVDTPSLISQAVNPGGNAEQSSSSRRNGRGVRLEAEVSSNTFWTGFLALRCLKRVGRFSKFGFEIGLSSFNLHLSLYWSRLGQRIRLPFLISSGSSLGGRILFWTTLFPMASMAAWEFFDHHRYLRMMASKQQARDLHKAIQKRRAEADEVQQLMAPRVEGRQAQESRDGGLVILSAKYGVKGEDWGEAEVADVKFAVAALVDHGQLHIPRGVRKSNIFGFWDPAPKSAKVLHIRYKYQGREKVVEVSGDDELRLPPI